MLFPDPTDRKAVYPTLGGPGVVLHEALPVGTWRGAAKAGRYEVTAAPFAALPEPVWSRIEAEAERLAHVCGHPVAAVSLLHGCS